MTQAARKRARDLPGSAATSPGEVKRSGARSRPLGRNVHDFLAHEIGTEIVGGLHPPGALLPNENDLRKRFRVSRTALREAFRIVAAKGLIVPRPKVGTRVRPKADWNMLDPDVLAWLLHAAPSEAFVAQLFELRQMVEPQAAAQAARLRSAKTLAGISSAYDDMERFRDCSGDLIGADLRFHQAILEATGNHFVAALGSLIRTALVGSFQLGWEGPAIMQNNRLRQHRAVLEAIRARKADDAYAHMAKLLRDSIGDVKRSLRRRAAGTAG